MTESRKTAPTSGSVEVIVAGLPRTGTTSMTRALEILLKGSVFDGGAASYTGTYQTQRKLLDLAQHCPTHTTEDRTFVLNTLATLTRDHIATSDQPGCYFVEELLELYPSAKVIVTTRDYDSWWASYSTLWRSIHQIYAWTWLDPFSQLRRFCVFSVKFWDRVPQAVGLEGHRPWWPMENHEGLYEAHAEYVKRVVPSEQLFYFNVKDGWRPLCDILGVDVPEQEPFPHIFPRAWLDKGTEATVARLKKRLVPLIAGVGLIVALASGIHMRSSASW
ncbi:hypothetical protein LTR05_008374 [Lithohypha guttulata]|uniref:P-loop containing nucleoside triphosphate hydrolase protein n=1 Tax=Lithohypha guttulata TaxID=1690604 RepID=A0AAN7SER2_9EURO|nr:hypothetical protein LTR05_008374 [Lithohypha guttulata]